MVEPSDRLPPRVVVGAEALAALAVPARFALLDHLLAAGPRTASQCAEVIGESASNCSWHLRALARVGLVEPADRRPGDDARTRPWRATAVGFDFSTASGPAAELAGTVVTGLSATHADRLYQRYLAARDGLPTAWTEAAAANGYALDLTPDELRALLAALDDLVRPYVRPIRRDAPAGSAIVHLTLRAFLNPDLAAPTAETAPTAEPDRADPA
ncbi:helix-turn-helix domain-containing protein [Micromonospora zhanjiangensis]